MKSMIRVALLGGVFWGSFLGQQLLFAQACKDEEGMVGEYRKSLTDLIEMVKKESLTDFEKAYHRRSCQTKLTLCLSMVSGLVSCLDKAAQDTAATKEQVDAFKAKREAYAKLKGKLDQDRNSLRAAEVEKNAKALIEKFDFSN